MRYSLFVCSHSAGRSQTAQTLLEHVAPADLRAESAGSEPAEQTWPELGRAMSEVARERLTHERCEPLPSS